MTDLYRGLMLVLTDKFNELILAFRTHIQSFKKETKDPNHYFEVGVLGFWNLMLEIILTLFSLFCLIMGVSLVASLAVVCYPLYAVLRYSALLVTYTRNPPPEIPELKEQITNEKEPIIIKKENNGLQNS